MSLEEKIENLTNVISNLTEVLFEAVTNNMKVVQPVNAVQATAEEKPKQTRTRTAKVTELKPEPKAEPQGSDEWGAETVTEERSLAAEETAAEEDTDWESEFEDFGSTKEEKVEIIELDQLRTQLNNLISAFAPSYGKKEGIDEKTMKTKLITKVRIKCNGKSITEILPEERKPLLDWVIKTGLKD
jgi:hypothetical protein